MRLELVANHRGGANADQSAASRRTPGSCLVSPKDEETKENFHRIERRYGKFTRSFTLPGGVDPEKVNAVFENGILEITLAKREEFKLDGDVQIETIAYDPTSMDALPGSTAPTPVNTMPANSARQNSGPHSALPKLKFLPDGTVDESSPQMIKLTGRDGFSIYVAQTRNRVNYEIRTRTSNN